MREDSNFKFGDIQMHGRRVLHIPTSTSIGKNERGNDFATACIF